MSRRRPLHPEKDEVNFTWKAPEQKAPPVVSKCEIPHNPLAWLAIPFHLGMTLFYALLILHGSDVLARGKGVIDPEGKVPEFGGRFKYLSHINVCVQLFFFATQLLTDLSPAFFKRYLQKFSDFVFTGIAFPLSAFVAITFWGLYAVDRELVYPAVLDKAVPLYLNHFWHSTIILWAVFEMYLFHHRFPSTPLAAVNAFIYGTLYIGWVACIYLQTNWWVYPFMAVLPPPILAIFFAVCMFFCFGLFLLEKQLMMRIWGVVTYLEWS